MSTLVEVQTDPPIVLDEIPRVIDVGDIRRKVFGKDPDEEYDKKVEDEEKRGTFLDNIIKELLIEDLVAGGNSSDKVESKGSRLLDSYASVARDDAADMLSKAMSAFATPKSLI